MKTISIKKLYIISLAIYLLSLPLGAIHISFFGSALKVVALLPFALSLFAFKSFKKNNCLTLYFVYVALSFFSISYSLNASEALGESISLSLLFLLMLSTTFFQFDKKDVLMIKKALIWSSRISALLALTLGTYIQGRLWLKNGIINEDPNYFCMYLSFGLMFAVISLLNNSKAVCKLLSVVEIFVYISIAFLSGSRGGVIALAIGIILCVILGSKKIFGFKKIVTLIILVLAVFFTTNLLSDSILERFTISNVLMSGGSDRTTIWSQGFNIFMSSSLLRKLFGYGIGNTISCFTYYSCPVINVMHNMFLQSLLEIGIIGLVLYTLMICSFVKQAFLLRDKFSFCVIFCMITMSLSTSISTFKPYLNIMIFILCSQNSVSNSNTRLAQSFPNEVFDNYTCLQ